MAFIPMSRVIQHLRQAALAQAGAELTDGQLLENFISRQDHEALAALVQRHAPMVWGVCRRLLPLQDAEDAFQATFLILVRKAKSIHPRAMVGNWLYGVARQAARNERTRIARRRTREVQASEFPEPAMMEPAVSHDWHPILDRELTGLPGRYRAVILLCDVVGKTRKEAAQQLGIAEGTIASRLARARALLAKRLTRQGVALAGGAVATLLGQNAVSAPVPSSVLSFTIQAAGLYAAGEAPAVGAISVKVIVLMEGVLQAMFRSKLKTAVMVLFVALGLVAFGGGLLQHQRAAARQDKAETEGHQPGSATGQPPRNNTSGRARGLPSSEAGGARSQSQRYKRFFIKTLGVIAEYFEVIDYANQYDGRIDARSLVPLKELPGVTRAAAVSIQMHADGIFALEIRVKKVKQVGERMDVVGRDTELERAILRRLNATSTETMQGARQATTAKAGTADKAPSLGGTGRIKVGDRLYIRVLNALSDNPIHGGYRVEPSGKVPLGPTYGRVLVSGLTPEEAEGKIRDHLAKLLRNPQVSVTWYDPVVHGSRREAEKEPRPAD